MAKSADNARVWSDGAVWVGPKGSTLPTDLESPIGVEFDEVGWLSDEGIALLREIERDAKKAWQGGATIRSVVTGQGRKITFQALETTAVTMGLADPGSEITTTAGVTKRVVKAITGQDIRAWVVDYADGTKKMRRCFHSGEASVTGDEVAKSDEITVLEFEVEFYPDDNNVYFEEYTNAYEVAEPAG